MFLNLGPELVRRGHRVTLLACRTVGRFRRAPLGGMRFVALQPRAPRDWQTVLSLLPLLRFGIATSGTPYISRIPALLEFIDAERPSVVVSGGTRCNLLNAMTRKLTTVPYRAVLTEHNPLSSKLRRISRRWKLRSIMGLYPYADAIAGVSAGVADELAEYLGRSEGVPVLPNPVVTPEYSGQRVAAPPHPWLTDGGPPVVLAVGALEPRKNFALLLRAIARLRQRRPLRLIVLGEGPERARLEALAYELGVDDAVAMPGFVSNVPAYLASAAALALSSTWEGFGCVIVEALACGCPVVATDCPYGPRAILADGRYGKLVEPGNDVALAVALDATLAQEPDRPALIERAADYSVGRSADAYLAQMFPHQAPEASLARSKITS
jgi:glycosyltransferase involved in cell wall biosynthesis